MPQHEGDAGVAAEVAAHWSTTDPAGRAVVASAPTSRRAVEQLARSADLGRNFDDADVEDPTGKWHVDDRCAGIAREAPGQPVRQGPFARAADALRTYAMADPRIVRACWYAGVPLHDRVMILEGRFGPLRFRMPVRVGTVVDATVEVDGRRAHVNGWDYETLEGHLERGRMDWSVWKWLDDGGVEFRIHAVSRRAAIRNPVVALGMTVFGRAMQLAFTVRSQRRLRWIATGDPDPPEAASSCTVEVGPLRSLGAD